MNKYSSSPSNVINVISQNAALVTEPLPNTAKITTNEWRVILTRGEHTRFGKSCAEITFAPGALGYAKRNAFSPDYIQVVCHTVKGNVSSWHIRETEADSLLTAARVAPDQDAVQRAWKAAWAQSF